MKSVDIAKGLKMENLENCFIVAKENLSRGYIAVAIEFDDLMYAEVIINPIQNMKDKLAYYKMAYDEDLNHKYSKGIRIVGFTYAENFEGIEKDFFL